jgi:hypothetical protein
MPEKISYEPLSSLLRNQAKSAVDLKRVMGSRSLTAEVNAFREIQAAAAPNSCWSIHSFFPAFGHPS